MDPRHLFLDSRLAGDNCVYCGSIADSRDHVPSKILLDDPLPHDLPVVKACSPCNSGFSLDEEYLACFVECVIAGSVNPELLSRQKIRSILSRKKDLAHRIISCKRDSDNGTLLWEPELERVHNVVVKLAKGHAAYELFPQCDEPEQLQVFPLIAISETEKDDFENMGSGDVSGWPEIGSRAFIRACGAESFSDQPGPWIVVQPGRYRYAVDEYGGVLVRIVLAEYLACIVSWK